MDISVLAGHVVAIFLAIFTPVLGFLATHLLRKLATKWSIDASIIQDTQVQWAVGRGVAYAEEWARTQRTKPLGSEKADTAFRIVTELLDNPIVQEYGIEALRNLIRAKVGEVRAETPVIATQRSA